MAKMVGGAVLFVAIRVLLGALVAGAIQYWPITLLAIGGIVGGLGSREGPTLPARFRDSSGCASQLQLTSWMRRCRMRRLSLKICQKKSKYPSAATSDPPRPSS